jgi:hypothetical protein
MFQDVRFASEILPLTPFEDITAEPVEGWFAVTLRPHVPRR